MVQVQGTWIKCSSVAHILGQSRLGGYAKERRDITDIGVGRRETITRVPVFSSGQEENSLVFCGPYGYIPGCVAWACRPASAGPSTATHEEQKSVLPVNGPLGRGRQW